MATCNRSSGANGLLCKPPQHSTNKGFYSQLVMGCCLKESQVEGQFPIRLLCGQLLQDMLMVCKALLRKLRTAWHIITWVWAEAGNRASKTRCHKAMPWTRSWMRVQAWSWLTFFLAVVGGGHHPPGPPKAWTQPLRGGTGTTRPCSPQKAHQQHKKKTYSPQEGGPKLG